MAIFLFANCFGLVFPGNQAPPPKKKSHPKFAPQIIGIPLRCHFLEPKNCSHRQNFNMFFRKIRAPIKIKSTPQTQNTPPPQNEEFYGHGFSCRKSAFFPGVHKIDAPISGPRIADKNFMDTRVFLSFSQL